MAARRWIGSALWLLALLGGFTRAWAGEPYTPSPFEIPQGAYSAEFVEDRNHVTIMRWSGNYDKKLPGGETNAAARAVVAQEFFRTHPDNYDFLVIFTGFEFDTGEATAFYVPVRNDIQGLGIPAFDNSALFGSNSKLQGYIDMAAMSRYSFNPFANDFEKVLGVLSHEVLHRWASHSDTAEYVRGYDLDIAISYAISYDDYSFQEAISSCKPLLPVRPVPISIA